MGDNQRTFSDKIMFLTPHAIIGREFDNVISIDPSLSFTFNPKTKDIVHADIINTCSRPKNQLVIIDLGNNDSRVTPNQAFGFTESRPDVLLGLVKKECILPQKISKPEALHHLRARMGHKSALNHIDFHRNDGKSL